MRFRHSLLLVRRAIGAFLVVFTALVGSDAAAQGTAFTYQGWLQQAGEPATGLFDLRCVLYDALEGGVAVSGFVTNSPTPVTNGLFSVVLDFGSGAFTGAPRWLEVAVRRTGDATEFAVLSPRQALTPAPYAILAGTVRQGSITAAQIAPGAVGSAHIAEGAVTATQLASGAAVANLNAGGQSGVATGGIVLSEVADSAQLADAGYVRIGKVDWVTGGWTTKSSGPPTTGKANMARAYHSAVWTGSEMIVWGGYDGGYLNDGARYNPTANSWSTISKTGAPAARSSHSAVWTGSLMLVWGGRSPGGGRYNPATDTWSAMATDGAPTPPRRGHSAVWTGTELVLWGGMYDAGYAVYYFNTGARYNPTANTWTAMSTTGAPAARGYHASVWTGSELLVWGGRDENTLVPGGARYNPTSDTWSSMATAGQPASRSHCTAVWTGSQMLVWGGGFTTLPVTGGRYQPSTDTWSAMNTNGAPTGRYAHTAIWTGSRMVIWGGRDLTTGLFDTGSRYDPAADTWSAVTTTGAPAARKYHSAVWAGSASRMIVWGGDSSASSELYVDTGGRYDVANNTWTTTAATPSTGEPGPRRDACAVWTGSEMIVWGGENDGLYLRSGGRFNPTANSWTALNLTDAPSGRVDHTAVWGAGRMIVWGGYDGDVLGTGSLYNPSTDTWLPMSTNNAPSARRQHTAVWTGSEMIVWGGYAPNPVIQLFTSYLNSGARYSPWSNSWTPINTTNAPAGRAGHTAVWTGTNMIVWGGHRKTVTVPITTTYYQSGGAYRPATDSWTDLSSANAPVGRTAHSAVWTGQEMLVWGGSSTNALNTGGRYRPADNTWTPISAINAPAARRGHSAVWTGWQMIVCGGDDGTTPVANGARYDPIGDLWYAITATARTGHSAVWTGSEMIYWGGQNGSSYLNDTYTYSVPHTVYLYLRP